MNNWQRDIIVGSILGDAYVNPNGGVTFPASVKHLDYLQWKQEALADLGAGKITRHDKHDDRYDRVYSTCRFYLGRQNEYRRLFYPEGVKIFPRFEMTPLIFAVWFLDDGNCVQGSAFSIATNGFLAQDVDRAIAAMHSIGLDGRRTIDGRIYLGAANKARVISYVKPIIVPSMMNKLDVRANAPRVDKVNQACPACGKVFSNYLSNHQTYCSRKCAAMARPSGYSTRTATVTCPICNRVYAPYHKNQASCRECKDKPLPNEICVICGKPASGRGAKTCSRKCNVIAGHRARRK